MWLSALLLLTVVIVGWLVLDRDDSPAMAGVVAAPLVAGFTMYLWKAKAENIWKGIRKNAKGATVDQIKELFGTLMNGG